jgi:hypothetical protein
MKKKMKKFKDVIGGNFYKPCYVYVFRVDIYKKKIV